ncbi:uncharacterized protein LOC134201685 isoform X1 [Bombyx mori]|uniref:uncharacterized protein LOC134201683 isoform X1 n=1 Tax=Bombyx mori TaxID=7091 RepID=UPI002ED3BE2A
MTDGFAKEDCRGKIGGGRNKTSEVIIEEAKDFILSLPLLPSHYCRRDSTKLYLPGEFKNITNLHRVYQAHFPNKKTMSFKVFSAWFHKYFNIGFHIPKKDKCVLCISAKSYDCKTEEEMNIIMKHQEEKEESYKRFVFHQKLNKIDNGTVCASFDLQKVLNTPHGESMLLYYTRKFSVYNLTIYESNTQLGICNTWTEADAKRGANEIATCLLAYLKDVDKRGYVKQVILYCDSCFGQNKNKSILAMLRYALTICENINNIQINYLIPGHTYMPVDSMHATIENSLKKTIVWAPSQWPTIMELARKNPEPYVVNVMTGKDFLGFENIVERTYKKNQTINISKICTVTFHKKHANKMFVKTSMLPGTEATEIQLGPLNNVIPKQNLYTSKLPISQKKYTDLKKMIDKNLIPERFAKEYLSLKTSTKVIDCLPDTDEEDD